MFTPEKLREMANEQDAIVEDARRKDSSLGFGPGNPGPGWQTRGLDAYREARRLRFAADYMEHFGIQEARQIGSYGNLKVKPGDKVRILKGAPLMTMGAGPSERAHKEIHGCHRFAKRSYVVTVSQNYEGWNSDYDFNTIREKYLRENLRNQTIEWAGTGGYWTWTSPEWVEVV